MTSPEQLLERIRNDRYIENQVSHGGDPVTEPVARREFNNGSKHVESLFLQWINEARLPVSLAELAEAECIDFRLKHALIAMDVNSLLAETVTPFGQQAAATPTAGEVVGGLEVRP